MGRRQERDPQQTRELIFQAASELISKRGIAVSIADIAHHAGVSKGGLLYHFPNKMELLKELGSFEMEKFRRDVYSRRDTAGYEGPGSLAKAYVEEAFVLAQDSAYLDAALRLAAELSLIEGLAELAQEDARRWWDDLSHDGIDPATVRLVLAATHGMISEPLWGPMFDHEDTVRLREQLLAMLS